MRHLLCGDEASNNGNWQWIASVGVDPAPYFRRMYNPMTQQRRHDPDGEYVRRWVPELRDVPLEKLAEPWTMSAEEQAAAGCVIGARLPGAGRRPQGRAAARDGALRRRVRALTALAAPRRRRASGARSRADHGGPLALSTPRRRDGAGCGAVDAGAVGQDRPRRRRDSQAASPSSLLARHAARAAGSATHRVHLDADRAGHQHVTDTVSVDGPGDVTDSAAIDCSAAGTDCTRQQLHVDRTPPVTLPPADCRPGYTARFFACTSDHWRPRASERCRATGAGSCTLEMSRTTASASTVATTAADEATVRAGKVGPTCITSRASATDSSGVSSYRVLPRRRRPGLVRHGGFDVDVDTLAERSHT